MTRTPTIREERKIDLLQNKKVAIIGGGPGGLTLARLLQLRGANVKVYERDFSRDVRVQGTTLDLHTESGLRALEKAGLLEAFKANYRTDNDRTRILDEHATIFFDDHNEASVGDFGDEVFRPEIDRGSLRKILLDSLQPKTVVWNSHVVSLGSIDDTWKIILGNGDTVIADIVIGADGANSKIRPFVTPIKPFYSGVTVLQCAIRDFNKVAPQIQALLEGGKLMGMGDSKGITAKVDAVAQGDGSLDFYLSWREDKSWAADSGIDFKDNRQVLEWFKKEYANWDSIWQGLFEVENATFIPRPQYCMPLDQCWEAQPNVTLLGDAAHLMPPFAGEGVNMAMVDALELSENLTGENFADMKSAIAHYEKQMFTRFAEIGKVTLRNTELLHSPDALKTMLSFKTR